MTPTEALEAAARALMPPGPLVVACSGGADSMALLHAAVAVGHWEVTAAFVDHGWGPHAQDAAAAVRSASAHLGVAAVFLRAEGAAGHGPEDRARRARLAVLEATAAGRPVALAHTREDQLETLLMRWAAGSGLRGLAGMPEQRGCFRRPWLRVPRAAVLEWLEVRGLRWAEDPTNADERLLRNQVRRRLLPALDEVFGVGWRAAAAGSAEHLRLADEWVEHVAAEAVARDDWSVAELEALGPLLRHRVVGAWGGGRRQRPTTATVEALLRRPPGTAVASVGGGRTLELAYGRLRFRVPPIEGGPPVQLDGPGAVVWGSVRVVVERATGAAGEVRIDQAAAPFPWSVRGPQPGDRLRLLGAPGSKPLNRLFIDGRVPRDERTGPVVADAAGPIFVRGLRVAERVRVVDGPAWALRLEDVESS